MESLENHEFAGEHFSPQDKALLHYSAKLSKSPSDMDGNDVQQLRSVGFDDRAIHDIACIVGYFAFVNRVANGLGVELEG